MKRQSLHRPSRFRPMLETLGERVLPAVTITNIVDPVTLAPGLLIVGTKKNDHIDIYDSSFSGVDIFVNGNQEIFGEYVEFFDIRLKGGNDALHIEIGDYCGESKSFLINTGKGHDEVEFITDDLLDGTNLQVQIADGGGRDTAYLEFDEICSSSLAVLTNMGAGNDEVDIEFKDEITCGSSIQLNVNLGKGNNLSDVDIEADVSESGIDIFVVGGKGADTALLDLDEDFEAFANINYFATLGAGNDFFEAEIGRNFDVDLFCSVSINVVGGAGNDTLIVTENEDNEFALRIAHILDLHLDGGNGNDNIIIAFLLDEGSFIGFGAVVVNVVGGNGNDVIDVTITNAECAEIFYDISILAGAGNDSVTFQGEDESGFCFTNGVLLDGGMGNQDRINYGTSTFDLIIKNFEINATPI